MNNQNEPYEDDAYLTNADLGGPTDMIEDHDPHEETYTLDQAEGGQPDPNGGGHPSVVNDVFDTLVCGMQLAFQNIIAPLAFDYGQVSSLRSAHTWRLKNDQTSLLTPNKYTRIQPSRRWKT